MIEKVALLLLALAAGYAVLALSQRQERPLDVLGRLTGGLILLVTVAGLVGMTICGIGCKMGRCGKNDTASCSMKKINCGSTVMPDLAAEAVQQAK